MERKGLVTKIIDWVECLASNCSWNSLCYRYEDPLDFPTLDVICDKLNEDEAILLLVTFITSRGLRDKVVVFTLYQRYPLEVLNITIYSHPLSRLLA